MREIISLQIGQAGIQMGNACWELFCLEHGIKSDGYIENWNGNNEYLNFYNLDMHGKHTPRSICIDFNTSVIDEVKTGF